jgi:acetyl-CoA acetyltransferase
VVDDVILGQAYPTAEAASVARVAALNAGLPVFRAQAPGGRVLAGRAALPEFPGLAGRPVADTTP